MDHNTQEVLDLILTAAVLALLILGYTPLGRR